MPESLGPWVQLNLAYCRLSQEEKELISRGGSTLLTCHEDAKCESETACFRPLAASCSLALSRACAAFAFTASLATDCPCSIAVNAHRTVAYNSKSRLIHTENIRRCYTFIGCVPIGCAALSAHRDTQCLGLTWV